MSFTRRSLCAAGSTLALSSLATSWFQNRAWAFGESARFIPAVGRHGGRWDARLSGLRRLTWELQRRTSVEVVAEARPLALSSPKLFEYPLLYLGSEGPMPAFSPPEVENLRRYLTAGGFLLADAQGAEGASDGKGFDGSFRRELARVLPQGTLEPIPSQHVIYKSFFLLDSAPGRYWHKPYLEGVAVGKRTAVVYSRNDLAGAWNRDEGGDYEFEVTPGGEPQRELSFRLGINLCMYALCLDYKDDAVHLPLILQKRR